MSKPLSQEIPRRTKIHAGAGCGKTTEVTNFYKRFLNEYKPSEITVLTFRKNAAMDLIHATIPYAKVEEKELKKHVGTIHSICWRLIGYPEMIDAEETKAFVKLGGYEKYMKKDNHKSNSEDYEESIYSGDMFDLYTWCRNTCTPFDKWRKYPGVENIKMPESKIPEFFNAYEGYKSKINKIDFSDMLQIVIDENIKLDTPILMVDEFQDLTAQMFKIFKMWEVNCDFVVIAGDENQSIYGYWGGNPYNLVNWEASEIVKMETFRLPEDIMTLSHRLLKRNGMHAPENKAKKVEHKTIYSLKYDSVLPSHDIEFHLIRCNYQKFSISMTLASEGKVFSGLCGWTDEEINLANAIISIRLGKAVSFDHMKALVNSYPSKLFGITGGKEDFINKLGKVYRPELQTGTGILSSDILDMLKSNIPTKLMIRDGTLFKEKMNGIKNRTSLITPNEVKNRRILTIHGSKGLEANAVFLHTAITPKIQKAIMLPGKDSQAEARVWYVGITRAKEFLYIIADEGKCYKIPVVA